MRLRRLILWVLFLGVVGWGGYTLVAAGWNHLATQDMVDKVLQEASSSKRMAQATGSQEALDRWAAEVRASMLVLARHSDLPLDERNIAISLGSNNLHVTIKWVYPLVTYGGENVVVIPMSVNRVVPLPR